MIEYDFISNCIVVVYYFTIFEYDIFIHLRLLSLKY